MAEAHPTESGDYIDYQYPVNDHKSIEDRLEATSKCQMTLCLIEQRRPPLHCRPAAEPGDAARAPAAGQHDGRGLQVLYCTVLSCTVLFALLLYCTVLSCTVLFALLLYLTVLNCTAYSTSGPMALFLTDSTLSTRGTLCIRWVRRSGYCIRKPVKK